MKVGVLVPDRSDRPEFLANCLSLIRNQTRQPDIINVVDYAPESEAVDLTQRVRRGFEELKALGCDCVLIMENDDYYHKEYVEIMLNGWRFNGWPDLFGTDQTTYYHITRRQYKVMKHPNRASLMNTLISCKAEISWSSDNWAFLDLHLWKTLKGKTFTPEKTLSLGIKHGLGLCGGRGHTTMNYNNNDPDFEFLKQNVDLFSFEFYKYKADKILKVLNN